MDVIAVEAAARRAMHAMRESRKAYFLECRTYRLRAHAMNRHSQKARSLLSVARVDLSQGDVRRVQDANSKYGDRS